MIRRVRRPRPVRTWTGGALKKPGESSSSASIWWLAFGYFACYAPYSALTKALSRGALPGMDAPLSGFELLPATTLASLVGMFAFLGLSGWFRHAGRRRVLGLSLPFPSRWTFLSRAGDRRHHRHHDPGVHLRGREHRLRDAADARRSADPRADRRRDQRPEGALVLLGRARSQPARARGRLRRGRRLRDLRRLRVRHRALSRRLPRAAALHEPAGQERGERREPPLLRGGADGRHACRRDGARGGGADRLGTAGGRAGSGLHADSGARRWSA